MSCRRVAAGLDRDAIEDGRRAQAARCPDVLFVAVAIPEAARPQSDTAGDVAERPLGLRQVSHRGQLPRPALRRIGPVALAPSHASAADRTLRTVRCSRNNDS